MYLFRIFYSFLPLRNPIGFGASDWLVLAIALLMVVMIIAKAWLTPFATNLAARTIPCMILLFAGAVLLRVALLPRNPVPIPSGADDFGYLLLGDTLAHFRLSNTTHSLYQFFEAVFILQQPTYSSIYPLGQGFVLAVGEFMGNPWLGVLLSSGVFCALCYWMLRAWVTPVWALTGGILAITQFGPLSPWVNSYWGGTVSAAAGCLIFGSLPRLTRSPTLRNGALLGLGLTLELLTRPFESVFIVIASALYLLVNVRPKRKPLAGAIAVIGVGILLLLAQNKAVTKSWTTLPYALSRYQYGVPATFTFQPNPVPHRSMTPEQALDYRAQSAVHGESTESIGSYVERLAYRFRFFRFFVLPPLYLTLLVGASQFLRRSSMWMIGTIILVLLGTNFYPYFYPHYVAALACLILLSSVIALQKLNSQSRTMVISLCGGTFILWFGIYASGDRDLLTLTEFQSWNYVNGANPQGRAGVQDQLTNTPGQQLVFVRYGAFHQFEEWIHNDADIDSAKTVWANDLGAEENQKLLAYYPARIAWLLQPDLHPPALTRYSRDRH